MSAGRKVSSQEAQESCVRATKRMQERARLSRMVGVWGRRGAYAAHICFLLPLRLFGFRRSSISIRKATQLEQSTYANTHCSRMPVSGLPVPMALPSSRPEASRHPFSIYSMPQVTMKAMLLPHFRQLIPAMRSAGNKNTGCEHSAGSFRLFKLSFIPSSAAASRWRRALPYGPSHGRFCAMSAPRQRGSVRFPLEPLTGGYNIGENVVTHSWGYCHLR